MVRLAHHKLGEVCEINPKLQNNLNPNLEVGFLTMADVSEDARITRIQTRKLSEVKKGFTNFSDGDVLVAKITPCFENGKGAFVQEMPNSIGFGSTEFHVLRVDKDVLLNKYLYYIVSSKNFRKIYAKFMTGSAGQQRISTDFLKKIKIPLPPLKIQKQIVERMDKITEAQKLNDELTQKADELFQSLLHKELGPAGPADAKALAGKKNWEVKNIGEVCKIIGGGTPSRDQIKHFKGDIPWVTVKDLHVLEIEDALEHINEEALKNSAANLVPAATVLVATRVGLGKVAIARKPLTFNQDIKGLRANDGVDADYLFYVILKNAGKIEKNGKGATVKGVTQEFLKSIKIPVPSTKTQKQIVEKLSTAQEYKKQLLEQKKKLKELFDSVLHKSMNFQG